MKVSQILAKTRLRQADGVFYEKQADGKCSFCAMGVLALKSGLITRKELINKDKSVHRLITDILRKFGIKEEKVPSKVECPLCHIDTERNYLIAHLNNKSGHGLNFKAMAKVLAEMGW